MVGSAAVDDDTVEISAGSPDRVPPSVHAYERVLHDVLRDVDQADEQHGDAQHASMLQGVELGEGGPAILRRGGHRRQLGRRLAMLVTPRHGGSLHRMVRRSPSPVPCTNYRAGPRMWLERSPNRRGSKIRYVNRQPSSARSK